MTEKISPPKQGTSRWNTSQKFNNQQKWRKNSRNCFNQNRGNRRFYINEGSNDYQNQFQNQGIYGKNFRVNFRGRSNSRRNNYSGNNRGNLSKENNKNNIFQQLDNQNAETKLNTKNAEGHIETTIFPQNFYFACACPNHTSRKYEARGRSSLRGGQIPLNSQSQN